jgi:hypothetical protein
MNSLHQIWVQAVRLERYGRPVKDKIWAGDHQDLIQALADTAEAAEISRRLWQELKDYLGELPVEF